MKTLILCAIAAVVTATAAQAAVPTGRFMQDVGTGYSGYRDIKISQDGKSAVWMTKDCHKCREVRSKPEVVVDQGSGLITIGGYEFYVTSSKGLFHPSMGDFGSGTFGAIEARH